MRLSLQLILAISGLLFVVLLGSSAYFILRHTRDIAREAEARAETMRSTLVAKGVRRVRILAGTAAKALEGGQELQLMQKVVAETVANDKETAYGLVMDAGRVVLVHNDLARVGQTLDDETSRFAAAATGEVSEHEAAGIVDVSAPVLAAGQRVATLRFGLSLDGLAKDIERSRTHAAELIADGALAVTVAAVALLLLGAATGVFIARRLLRPLALLGDAVHTLKQGDYQTRVAAGGSLEIAALGHAFNEMAEKIGERDRLKSEFIANVSHELRTPLNAIVNVPSLLQAEYERTRVLHCPQCGTDYEPSADDERCSCGGVPVLQERLLNVGDADEQFSLLTGLDRASKHLLMLVNNLLDFTKLQARKTVLHYEPIAVPALLADLQRTLEPLLVEKHLSVHTTCSVATLECDVLAVTRVLLNLLGNAVKFTPADGAITVSVSMLGEQVLFSVKDTGPGLATDQLEVIFDSFHQVDGGHTRVHGGTGLGLAIVRELVTLLGGRVWCESAPGEGATFLVLLPSSYRAGLVSTSLTARQRAAL